MFSRSARRYWICRFANENTLLMTVSVETVRSAKSRPSKNLSERSVSVSAYLLCFIVINLTFVISDFTYNNAFRLFFGRHRRPHVSMLYHFKLPLFEQSQYHFSVLSGIGLSFILTTDQLHNWHSEKSVKCRSSKIHSFCKIRSLVKFIMRTDNIRQNAVDD